ncbi:TetR family transcriptional regulator [Camelimonas fluminis]|uniref:TetR/AcrR family transcriptional regulator n=1 Tax=Camelimonas fluminis TaxID=1576911 RepID=A0ABV7UEF5_9HYPH|nr:TetR family transcriptional regulator [Camelimonas fluminis]GHE51636.1 TetR family transcriptional regulator [Camelimonas fluminis]
MGHSQAGKSENRERILAEASRQVRKNGLESVSVGELMKSVGLTHGGFYGHFNSRAALLAEALARALADGQKHAKSQEHATGQETPTGDLPGFARSYLSRTHRDAPESGCAIAALAAEAGRAAPECRDVMSGHVDAFIGAVAEMLDGDEEKAMVAVSAMVGALALARVATSAERSDAILKAVREHMRMLVTD